MLIPSLGYFIVYSKDKKERVLKRRKKVFLGEGKKVNKNNSHQCVSKNVKILLLPGATQKSSGP